MDPEIALDRLPELVERLASYANSHLVVDLGGTSYYVQLASGEGDENDQGWLLGEAVSNEFLEGAERIPDVLESALVALGWRPPRSECAQPGCDMEHPNFFRFWDTRTIPATAIAGVLLRTLALYGADEGRALHIRASFE